MVATQTIASREIMCGLSYLDIVGCAGMSQKDAAKKLGVNYEYFRQVMARLAMSHWFSYTRPTGITREDVIKVAADGVTQYDAAFLLGVNYQNFCLLVKRWKLRHLFPSQGESVSMGRDYEYVAHVSKLSEKYH